MTGAVGEPTRWLSAQPNSAARCAPANVSNCPSCWRVNRDPVVGQIKRFWPLSPWQSFSLIHHRIIPVVPLRSLTELHFLLLGYCLRLQKPSWNAITRQVFSLCWYIPYLHFHHQICMYGMHNAYPEHEARRRPWRFALTPGLFPQCCFPLQRADQDLASHKLLQGLMQTAKKHSSSMPFCFYLECYVLWNSCELLPYCWWFQRKKRAFQARAAVGFFAISGSYQEKQHQKAASEIACHWRKPVEGN